MKGGIRMETILKVFMYALVAICAIVLLVGAFTDLISDIAMKIALAGLFFNMFVLCPIHFELENGTF